MKSAISRAKCRGAVTLIAVALVLAAPMAGRGSSAYAQGPSDGFATPTAQDPFIDPGMVLAGCGIGIAAGSFTVATYPLWKWAKDAGALLSIGILVWRSLLGCYFGLIGGVVTSAADSTLEMITGGDGLL